MAGEMDSAIAETPTGSATPPAFTELPLAFGREDLEFIVGVFAWVDYDADGWLDLMVSGLWTDGTAVRFARNNHDGTFTLRDAGITNFYASTVSCGDYDRDGLMDLLMTGTRPQVNSDWPLETRIYRGEATRTFRLQPTSFPGVIGAAHWGDFNNDGALDVLVVGRPNNGGGAVARIYRNDSAGKFTDIEASLPPRSDDAGSRWFDFNGDGFLDVRFRDARWVDGTHVILNQYFLNNGDETFVTSPAEVPISGPEGMRGDFDNDGWPDLLRSTGSAVQVYKGDGTFTNLVFQAAMLDVKRLGWGDYDRDGDLDFFASDGTFGGGGEGRNLRHLFRNNVALRNQRPQPPSVLSAALQTNNRVVLTWTSSSDNTTPAGLLTYDVRVGTAPGTSDVVAPLWTASGAARLAQPGAIANTNRLVLQDLPRGTYYWSVKAIDAGFADSAISTEASFSVTKPQIAPITGQTTAPGAPITIPVLVSDVETPAGELRLSGFSGNRPLVPDANIIFGGNGSNRTMTITPAFGQRGSARITVTLTDQDGYSDAETFALRVEMFTRTTEFPAVSALGKTAFGDYDNDGWMDFVIVDNISGTAVWRNNRDGTFTNAVRLPAGIGSANWGDYDNDADLDLLLTGLSEEIYPSTKLYRNDGANAFTEVSTNLKNLFGAGIWGDLDGDGDLDVLLSGHEGPNVQALHTLIYGNDRGAFREITNSLPGVELPGAAFADFDNDGDLDLAHSGYSDGFVVARVYRNDGSGHFSDSGLGLGNVPYHTAEWGNFDNDGFFDILLGGSTSAVYRNTRSGGLERLAAVFPQIEWLATWGDANNDGWLDMLLAGAGSTRVLQNNHNGEFSNIAAEIPNLDYASGGWFDADNDGDLDVLLFGNPQYNTHLGRPGYIYRNNTAVSNTPPWPPGFLAAGAVAPSNHLQLSWVWTNDEQTPANGLTYNVRLGTTPGGDEIIPSHAAASNGQRRLVAPGNAGHMTTKVAPGLPDGVYYWSVQAIDTAFAGSEFAPEQSVSFFRPTISSITNVDVYPGSGPIVVPFQISDPDAEPASLLLRVSVSDTNLFPVGHIFSGSGTNRTLTLSPVAGLTGTATVTIVVTDELGLQVSTTFRVSVEYFREAQTTLADVLATPALWADFDNDDDLDALLGGSLYRNDGQNIFTRILSGLPLGDRNGIAWADYNNDGWLDLLTAGNGTNRIYRNEGGTNLIDINANLPPLTDAAGAWGDFDNDGDRDLLLTGDAGPAPLTRLYRNDGQDRFFALNNGGLPAVQGGAVAWGDFDADGKLDVLLAGGVVATWTAGAYRNVGNGFFELAFPFSGATRGAVAWGDYDGNGTLDALVAGYGNAQYRLNIYRNNGDRTFTELSTGLQGIAFGTAKWADFDNDGDLDIFAGGAIENANARWITHVYRNDGNDSFSILPTALPQTYNTSADWGDYDRDGDLDILLSGQIGPGPQSVVRVFRNESPTSNAPPFQPAGLMSELLPDNDVALRWNPSGDSEQASAGLGYALRVRRTVPVAEMLFPHANLANGFRRLPELGHASSNVWLLRDLARGTYAWSVQAIDAGLAGSPFAAEGTFTITNARPTIVGLSNVMTIPNSSAGPLAFTIGDFETASEDLEVTAVSSNQFLLPPSGILLGGSGSNRTVTVTPAPNQHGTGAVTIIVTDASGLSARATFTVTVEQFTLVRGFANTQGGTVAWADHDNDNDLDLLVAGLPGGTRLQRNDGNGVFTELTVGQDYLSDGAAAWADFDHDGYLDFAESGSFGGGISFQGTLARRNNGNATYTRLASSLAGVAYGHLAWGDYDNDGDADLLLGGHGFPHGSISRLYRNDVYGQAFVDTSAPLLGLTAAAGTWADFDGDAWLDALVTGSTNFHPRGAHSRLYINDRSGSFVSRPHGLPAVSGNALAVSDFDRDGDLDVALSGADPQTNRVCGVFRNDGNGSFTQFAALTGAMDGALSWGDFDGDGWPDLLVTGKTNSSPQSGAVTLLYRNQAGAAFELAPVNLEALPWTSAAWGDYDNNGTLDLALTGSGGSTRLHRNNQPPVSSAVAAPTGLAATVTANEALLTWQPPADANSAVTYNVRLGTTPGGIEIINAEADAKGFRRVAEMGNAGALTRKLARGLPRGTYYWSVQAVDARYRGSAFSTQAVFVVTNTLPPTLSSMPSLVGIEDGRRLTNFLTGISRGNVVGPLTLTVTNLNPALSTNLQTQYISPQSTGQIVIRLRPDGFGTGDVQVTVSGVADDGQVLATSRTFSLMIIAVNDAPVASRRNVAGTEDTALPITLNAFDLDGDTLFSTIVSPPRHGTLSGSGLEFVYRPHTNYFGTDSFDFRVSDGITNSTAEVVIALTGVPDTDAVLLRMTPAPEQKLVLNVQAEPYVVYAVQVSTNLIDWTDAQTLRASPDGLLSLTISPDNQGSRFYRTRALTSN
jgi:hypothetical protein